MAHNAEDRRVVFRSAWLPYALVAPQVAITIVFFFWPAAQAVWYSFQLQDAFGLKTQFVGLQNFETLFNDPNYLESFKVTAVFSALVAFFGLSISLLLAVMADRVLRGAMAYKTLLIWPYAVAPAVAGVLWARCAVVALVATSTGLFHQITECIAAIVLSDANWDAPPGSGYFTVAMCLVAAIATAVFWWLETRATPMPSRTSAAPSIA